MRNLLDTIDRWRAEGQAVALARVVSVQGSGPREPGAAMAVSERGEVAGSVTRLYDGLAAALRAREPVTLATVLDGTGALVLHPGHAPLGSLGSDRQYDGVPVFLHHFLPPPTMLVLGAVDYAAALAADEVVVDGPDRLLRRVGAGLGPRDAVCILTHDTRFDVPTLIAALSTGAGCSRRTRTVSLSTTEGPIR